MLNSSCALTFCSPAVSASICFCWRAIIAPLLRHRLVFFEKLVQQRRVHRFVAHGTRAKTNGDVSGAGCVAEECISTNRCVVPARRVLVQRVSTVRRVLAASGVAKEGISSVGCIGTACCIASQRIVPFAVPANPVKNCAVLVRQCRYGRFSPVSFFTIPSPDFLRRSSRKCFGVRNVFSRRSGRVRTHRGDSGGNCYRNNRAGPRAQLYLSIIRGAG